MPARLPAFRSVPRTCASALLLPPLAVLLTALPLSTHAAPRGAEPPAATEPDPRPEAAPGAPAPGALTPPALLEDSPAIYPPELSADRIVGEAVLELTVDTEGRVHEAELVQSSHPAFASAALEAAPSLRFSPARLDGAPVAVRLSFTYRFEAPPPPPTAAAPAPVAPPAVPAATLVGRVRTRGSRDPVPGAVVRVVAPDGALVETDAEGTFVLGVPANTQVEVEVAGSGHRAARFQERVRAGERVEVTYSLEPLEAAAYQTVVRGERTRTEVSRVRLAGAEVHEVPGTMGDPFRVVMLMPGVSSVLSGVPHPVVRGSQPAATGYFVDGVRVPMLFHALLGPAVVHPDFLEGVDFIPGAAPARYGRLMGGSVEGRVAAPREEGLDASAFADLLNAGLYAAYPFSSTGTSITASGRLSYTPVVAEEVTRALTKSDEQVVLDFYDYQARLQQRVGPGELRLLAMGASDTAGVRLRTGAGTTAVQSMRFHRVDLRHRAPLGAGRLEVGATWGVDSAETQSIAGEQGVTVQAGQRLLAGRLGYSVPLGDNLTLESGADVEHREAQVGLVRRSMERPPTPEGGPLEPREDHEREPLAGALFAGAWTQLVASPWRGATLTPGVRVDSYHLLGGPTLATVEPRLSLRQRLSDALTLKAGGGLFHQPPTSLFQLPVMDLAALDQGLQQAWQGDVGAEWALARGWELQTDAYVNRLSRTVESDPLEERPRLVPSTPERPQPTADAESLLGAEARVSDGWAYGLELLLRHPLQDSWFGWLSYTLQRSVRRATFPRYDAAGRVVEETTRQVPFAYDQTHVVNLVLGVVLPGQVTLGGALHARTGRPEFGTMGASRQGHRLEPDELGGTWRPVDRDAVQRLPGFYRLDVRVAKAFLFDDFQLEAYLDVLNATLNREVTGYNYTYTDGAVSVPGTPVAPAERARFGAARRETISVPLALPMLGLKARY